MHYFYVFLITSNVTGFFLMGYDKFKAKHGRWRVPELNLFLVSLLGGAAGVYAGMKIFKHKTRHNSFVIEIPLLLGLNVITAYLIVR